MKVGIYFKMPEGFLIDAVPVDAGEAYGEAVGHSGHYDFHANLRPTEPLEMRFKAHDYDYYPRGRVVFFPVRKTFVIYVDPCLTQEDIEQVQELFGLNGQVVEFAEDDHYRCAKCNGHYLE